MTLRHAQAPSLNRLVYVEPAVAEFARNPLRVTNRGRKTTCPLLPVAPRMDADRCSGTAGLTMANFSCLLGASRSFQLSAGAVP
jgi:hypothetical protein